MYAQRRLDGRRKVFKQLGKTIPCYRYSSRRSILFRIFIRKIHTENVECHASQILLQLINKISALFPRSVVLSLRKVFDRDGFNEALHLFWSEINNLLLIKLFIRSES